MVAPPEQAFRAYRLRTLSLPLECMTAACRRRHTEITMTCSDEVAANAGSVTSDCRAPTVDDPAKAEDRRRTPGDPGVNSSFRSVLARIAFPRVDRGASRRHRLVRDCSTICRPCAASQIANHGARSEFFAVVSMELNDAPVAGHARRNAFRNDGVAPPASPA